MISFHTGIFREVWGLISGGRGLVVLALDQDANHLACMLIYM